MSEATKTIAFRVPPSIEQQIDQLAKEAIHSKAEWVRDQVMNPFNAEPIAPASHSGQSEEPAGSDTAVLEPIESRITKTDCLIREGIRTVKFAVRDTANEHQKE